MTYSTDHENRAEEAEKHKQDQLDKAQKTGQGEYKEEIASDSERSVRLIALPILSSTLPPSSGATPLSTQFLAPLREIASSRSQAPGMLTDPGREQLKAEQHDDDPETLQRKTQGETARKHGNDVKS